MKLKRVGIIALGVSLCLGARESAATNSSGTSCTPPPPPPRGERRSGNGNNGRHTSTNGNGGADKTPTNVDANGSAAGSNDVITGTVPKGDQVTARPMSANPFETDDADVENIQGGKSPVEESICETNTSPTPERAVEREPLILKIEEVDSSKIVTTTIGNVKCFRVIEDVNVFSSVEIGSAKKAINCVGPESVVCYVYDAKKHYIMVANKIQDSWRRCNLSVEKDKTFIRRDFASGTKFPVDIDFVDIFNKREEEPVEEEVDEVNEDDNVDEEGETNPLEEQNGKLGTLQSSTVDEESKSPVQMPSPKEPTAALPVPVPAPATAVTQAATTSSETSGRLHAVQVTPAKSSPKTPNVSAVAPAVPPVEETVPLADGRIEEPLNSTLVYTQTIAEAEPEIIYTYKHNDEPFFYHYRVKKLPNRQLYHKVGYGRKVPDLLKTLSHLGETYDSEVPILFWDCIHASALLAGYSLQVYENFSILDLAAGNEDVLFVMANMELWLQKQASHQLVLYNGATRSWLSLESTRMGSPKRFLITPDPHYPGGCTLKSIH